MNRLETLKKLESTLENFIAGVVRLEADHIELAGSVQSLERIAGDSLHGRNVNNRLGEWFAGHSRLLDQNRLQRVAGSSVGNLLGDIRSGLDETDPEGTKLIREIDRWRSRGVMPRRKLVLTRAGEEAEVDIAEEFKAVLADELKEMEYYRELDGHLLSVLDDVLKSAAAKEGKKYLHLAGSIIYYLKINGYKVEPYVKKLKELESSKLGFKA